MNIVRTILLVSLLLLPQFLAAQEPAPKAATQVEMSFKTSDAADVGYLLYLPKDYQANSDKKFALIFFLHGRGESNGPLSLVAKWGPPMMAARGDDMPYVIVSPQCPAVDSWASETQQLRLLELLNDVVKHYQINEQKIFLTGLSMGGYGSWKMAADHPDLFAAVAPVCGGGDPADADKLKNVPIWVFHGDQDGAVQFEKSVEMVDAIKAAGGTSIRFTSLEHIGHNCWSAAYATPELYQWMDQQTSKMAAVDNKIPAEKASVAVDPTGIWTWDREFNGNTMNFTLNLEAKDGAVTGTYKTDFAGGDAPPGLSDPIEIENGKLVGGKLTFEVTREFNGNEFIINYSGVVEGDEILGLTEMDFGGDAREFEWQAKRSKSGNDSPAPEAPKDSAATGKQNGGT